MASRKELSLSDKVTLLDKIRLLQPNTSNRVLSDIFDVSKSTIARHLNQEQDLREILLQKERMKQGKRQRLGKDPEVEEALNKWFKSVLDKGENSIESMFSSEQLPFWVAKRLYSICWLTNFTTLRAGSCLMKVHLRYSGITGVEYDSRYSSSMSSLLSRLK